MLSDMVVGTTLEALEAAATSSVDNQHEGIVIKDASSQYKLDTRTKGGWWKWKPEYVDALSDHLDMMIVGGYYSDASRGNTVKQMGAANGPC